MEFDSQGPIEIVQHLNHSFESGDRQWHMGLSPLAIDYGITTHLASVDHGQTQEDILWLDWHDMLSKPQLARLHIMGGENEDAKLGETRKKIEDIAAGILAYDSLMVNTSSAVSLDEAREVLMQNKLPRLKTSELNTSYDVWISRFRAMGFPELTNVSTTFHVPWAKLVEIAKIGKFR
jgi:hypothetical protein